ncbi:MAG TPA: NAD(P)H-binding protein [Flavobacterium sp.]|nr:NAD(P)H-binding protein [Flavobacterium sp.]
MKVLLIGATSATGKFVLQHLIKDERIDEIVVFVRKITGINSTKLKEVVVDFDRLADYKEWMQGNVAISCLGTTLKQAGSKEKQWLVDHDYQLEFARLTKENGVSHFILLSAIGVSETSSFFYNRMRGSLENAVKKLQFPRLDLLRPSILIRPNSDRLGEKVSEKILKLLNTVGILKSYQPIHVQDLAKVMQDLIFVSDSDVFTHEVKDILKMLQKK